jgi:hypothetical protein
MRGKERMRILHKFDTQGVVVYWSSCNMTMPSYILFYRRSMSEFGHYLEALRNCIVVTRKSCYEYTVNTKDHLCAPLPLFHCLRQPSYA